jgi:hypothetical protein
VCETCKLVVVFREVMDAWSALSSEQLLGCISIFRLSLIFLRDIFKRVGTGSAQLHCCLLLNSSDFGLSILDLTTQGKGAENFSFF